jgi:hypothetical protein
MIMFRSPKKDAGMIVEKERWRTRAFDRTE